jgi:ubiquinone/menaquinone biosynthesis C-methylase UbiE/uncharacterized protein YbaR (Trm112 family)
MRESILESLQCPVCRGEGKFALEVQARDPREIREGQLTCGGCKSVFPIHAGIVDLLPSEQIRREVAREIEGWIANHVAWFDLTGQRDNFWLVEPDNAETRGISADEYLRRIPHYEQIGPTFERNEKYKIDSYRELLERAPLSPGERCLELGAGRCWNSRDFTRMGCRCTALDIVTTKYIGLECSDVYFAEDPDLYWERVRGDMEALPFASGAFDVVFCNAVLHHTKDLARVLAELHRVLTPTGRVLIVNEPDYGLFDHRKCLANAKQELDAGVNENIYNCRYLARRLKQCGFESEFYPLRWLVEFYAWRLAQSIFHGGKTGYRFQKMAENGIYALEPVIRWFLGLGTLGVARKRG